ncbi:MAG: hypothetical protein V2B20_16405 [Pseudomonadota bacterium]
MKNVCLKAVSMFSLVCVVVFLLFAMFRSSNEHAALRTLPKNMLWAWERNEDLQWLEPESGVAYVACVVELQGDKAMVRPRQQQLLVRDDTAVIPVVHVDAIRGNPTLSNTQITAIVDQTLAVARRGTRNVVQLDFEAKKSQRPSLLTVIKSIRQQLPAKIALSMTTLASWCAGDYWLEPLPVDEIVPMAFRMGGDNRRIRILLDVKGGFPHERCRQAVGVATDEAVVSLAAGRRYHFSPVAWQASAWRAWQKNNEGVKIE